MAAVRQLAGLAGPVRGQRLHHDRPGWPDDPATVEQGRQDPDVFAHKMVQQVTDRYLAAIAALDRKPAVIGHSFDGLITLKVAGDGVSAASVAIDNAPFKGVLPLPISSLKSAAPAYHVPAAGAPLFQAAVANLNLFGGETRVRADIPDRGPVLVIAGGADNTVPAAITHATHRILARHSSAVTELVDVPGRGSP